MDEELRHAVVAGFVKKGMKVDEAPLSSFSLKKKEGTFLVSRKHTDGKQINEEEYDQVFNCWGRISKVDTLALENAPAVKVSQGSSSTIIGGHLGVPELTHDERIFAVGDVLRGTARNNPAAEFGGKRVAKMIKDLIEFQEEKNSKKTADSMKEKEKILSKYRNFSNSPMPVTVFTSPSASMVGMTEEEAKKAYGTEEIGSVTMKRYALLDDFSPTANSDLHFYKLVYRKADDKILGIHYRGDNGEDVIYGLSVAFRQGLTRASLQDAFFIHPSRSEVFWKASDAEESATLESC